MAEIASRLEKGWYDECPLLESVVDTSMCLAAAAEFAVDLERDDFDLNAKKDDPKGDGGGCGCGN